MRGPIGKMLKQGINKEDSYNERVDEALNHCKRIVDEDWRTACMNGLKENIMRDKNGKVV